MELPNKLLEITTLVNGSLLQSGDCVKMAFQILRVHLLSFETHSNCHLFHRQRGSTNELLNASSWPFFGSGMFDVDAGRGGP